MQQIILQYLLIGIFIQATYTLLPSPFKEIKPHFKPTSDIIPAPDEKIQQAIEVATRITNFLEDYEQTIERSSRIDPNSPAHGLFVIHQPEWKAVERGRQALLATKASAQFAYICAHEQRKSLESCSNDEINNNFLHSSLKDACTYLQKKCRHNEIFNKYRAINGVCNHVNKGSVGESFTAFERLLKAEYLNHFESQKRSVTKSPLPSPRKISNAIVKHDEDPHAFLTTAFSQFGQFLENDLSQFASSTMIHLNESFTCCDHHSGFKLAPRYLHPLCMSISVPSDDPYYSKRRIQCMSYVRSLPAMKADCTMGSLEQQNQATHFIDGSQIYGATFEKSLYLRSKDEGKLKMNENQFLPLSNNPQQQCHVSQANDVCFVSGDHRVNLHPQLTVMYTLWVREHNRIASELHKLNPHWNDEELFQEARNIVIAEMQHITYHEWLKHLLGKKKSEMVNKFSKYSEEIDPSVSNEFATAAIRSLNSMFPNDIRVTNKDHEETLVLKIHEYFNKPEIIIKKDIFDSLVRGLTNQRANNIGRHFSEELTNKFLFTGSYGYDILSLDIQRGRDHGLQGYNSYRHLCGLPKASAFDDFKDVMSNKNVKVLSQQYQHIDDVDLLVGGLLEKPVRNSLLGPTFSCLVGDQFLRTKRGDRYFYENLQQPSPFTSSQMEEIRKISLAKIFCDNSDLKVIQPEVFKMISQSNTLVDCAQIPMVDLKYWKDTRTKNLIRH